MTTQALLDYEATLTQALLLRADRSAVETLFFDVGSRQSGFVLLGELGEAQPRATGGAQLTPTTKTATATYWQASATIVRA